MHAFKVPLFSGNGTLLHMHISQDLRIAASILLGFALIAAAIAFSPHNALAKVLLSAFHADSTGVSLERAASKRIIYGNPKAPVKLIEFADLQCPYCSEVHNTLKQIVDGSNGTIVWEYRHFPLPIHPYALPASHYAECMFELSGTDAFWKFADTLIANQRSLSDAFFKQTAASLGIDEKKLATCITDQNTVRAVTDDLQAAEALGGNGTPYTIIVYKDGSTKPVSGALPYAQWKSLLNI